MQAMSTAHGGTGGSIVNIASVAANWWLSRLQPTRATKVPVTFTRGWSNEVASEGSGLVL